MESSTINRGGLLGGIGLFLFGMSLFEHTIQESGKGWLKHTLKKYTNTLPKSIITGTLQTFVFQSSTIVTMITLGFVGAGIIGLYNALGVVLGANIGSSLTTRLVALLGFNFKIENYVLPVIGLSGLAMIMTSAGHRIHKTAKIITGFGLLFLGLGYMKESVDTMTNAVNFASYADWPLRGFMIIGAIVTTIIQTSTGVTIITLTALSGGLITLDMGLGIIVGANIGSALSTGIMGLLSSTHGQHTKKQVALSQIIFNVVTALIVVPLIYPLKDIILKLAPLLMTTPVQDVSYQSSLNEMALAMFHTSFNIVLVSIRPLILKPYSIFVSKLFISKESSHKLAIEKINTGMSEELINALHQDISYLLKLVRQYYTTVLGEHGPRYDSITINLYNNLKATQTTLLNTIKQQRPHITEHHIIATVEELVTIIMDACAGSASVRETLDHCENISHDQENQGTIYYNNRRTYLKAIDEQLNELPPYIKPGTTQDYLNILNKSIIQHRQMFMDLVQQSNSNESEFISELIKTDYYITNASQELIRARVNRHSTNHKVLEL